MQIPINIYVLKMTEIILIYDTKFSDRAEK